MYWNGDPSLPMSSGTYGSQINQIRSAGGNVIPSFGGYSADHDGTDIADSCTSVSKIAAAYEKVISTYNVPRIGLDVEDNSLGNNPGITRRSKAIAAQVESWAAANGRSLQVSYTLPSQPSGLESDGRAVIQNAINNNARVDVVNIMTFDYYDGSTHNMLNDAESAGNPLDGQLHSPYPSKSTSQRWAMVGISWASSKGVNTLSFWALQRDNGGCPGTGGGDTCSGVSQSTWQFSHGMEPLTHS